MIFSEQALELGDFALALDAALRRMHDRRRKAEEDE